MLRGGRIVRRSRGYVPATLPVAPAPPLLAVGAELKSTFALARDGRAWVGHHIGDLRNYETLRSFTDGVAHFERLFAVTPELVAHDLHPEYLSTKFALDRDLPGASASSTTTRTSPRCLAEHGVERAAGAIFDGTGYGTDGTVWGGELLRGDLRGLRARRPPLAGADARRRGRDPRALADGLRLAARQIGRDVRRRTWEQVAQLARTGLASPLTTSMGRLFDAVAALCGLRDTVTYEGQAAIELEAAADPRRARAYPLHTCMPGQARYATAAIVLDARRRSRRSSTTSRAASPSRSSPRASTTRSPRATAARARATSRSSSSPAACSRTQLLLERTLELAAARAARPARAARSTTGRSPTARRRSRRGAPSGRVSRR